MASGEKKGKQGVLLVNMGSPLSPSTGHIRKYLAEFLSDKRVMTMPGLMRWLILNLFILPFRPSRIKGKYESIWDGQGFPLLMHGKGLVEGVADLLGDEYEVALAMRYGSPSLENELEKFRQKGVHQLLILPLFPQYASATTGSIVEKVFETIGRWQVIPELITVHSFYDYPPFIQAWVSKAKAFLESNPDWILFSFHGLPESHILEGDPGGETCLKKDDCCSKITGQNVGCYRAHCIQTAKRIAKGLDVTDNEYSISFQSRLGRTRWLEPFTLNEVKRLAEQGIKRLMILCPSFVADCLETTEEIEVEVKNEFIKHGGRELILVPSLNTSQNWIECVAGMISQRMGSG
jgi:protoporphyrin/coproporphyrin ferrochelatase